MKIKKDRGRPEYGKQYALTGTKDSKCIMNGNTWAESEIKPAAVDLRNRTVSGKLNQEAEKDPKVAEIINAVCDLATD